MTKPIIIPIGQQIITLHGENAPRGHPDEHDQPRQAEPRSIGAVWLIDLDIEAEPRHHLTFQPSQVWIILEHSQITDPQQSTIL